MRMYDIYYVRILSNVASNLLHTLHNTPENGYTYLILVHSINNSGQIQSRYIDHR